jgi:hypothetical protein
MALPFEGAAWALSSEGLSAATTRLGVYAAEIWTILGVETSGCGYLSDRRPQILYERHIFHRLTNGRFNDDEISDPNPGGYGPRGASQYDRLNRAIVKDPSAALQSASWGIGQIMGENFHLAGYSSVEDMVTSMCHSEDNQLAAMASFLLRRNLHIPLRAHDWTTLARAYNGPSYAINRYDIQLAAKFQKYSSGLLPDLDVRAAQLYLTYLGFHPGTIDGVAGQYTLSALTDFQRQKGLSLNTLIDQDVVARLRDALPNVRAATAQAG